jgi:hypothetical protein
LGSWGCDKDNRKEKILFSFFFLNQEAHAQYKGENQDFLGELIDFIIDLLVLSIK